MALLKERLCAGQQISTLTAVNGLPGVGKTTLAATLAHDPEIRTHFSDGILWASLGTTPDIIGQLRRWVALFGLHETQMASRSIETLALRVRSAIRERRMFVIIDDAWALEDALTFQIGGSNCVYLVTTRFPHIASQLAPIDPMLLRELSCEQSLDLLHLLAPQAVEQEREKAHVLMQTVGGLPLALTLIGNYLRRQAASGQRRRVQAALEQLKSADMRLQLSEPRSPIQRHPSLPTERALSLSSVIALSDQHLSDEARAALYALSVLPHKPHSFSEEAALSVSAAPVSVLDALLDTGLVESSGDGRYTLHQTIADYARLQLQGMVPHERLLQYAHDILVAHRTDYELLDLEAGTILASLEAAYRLGKKQELVQVACHFIPFLLIWSNYLFAERHIQRVHEAAVSLNDDRSIVMMLLYRGQIISRQGNGTLAEISLQEGLALARQIDDQELMSALLKELGLIAWRRGKYARTEAYLEEGLPIARQSEDPERVSGILDILGILAASRGEYAEAEEYHREGLALARQIGERENICTLLIRLGITIGEQGHFSQAEESLREGLTLARQIGHSEWMSVLLLNQALLERKQRHLRQAEESLQEGLALARRLGIPQIMAYALYESGHLFLQKQHVEAANENFREMLALIPDGDRDLFALSQYGLARVAAAQGNKEEAQRLASVSLEAAGQRRHSKEVRRWFKTMGE